MLAYVLFAIPSGYISFLVNNSLKAAVLALVMLIVATLFIRFVLRIKEKYGWYASNGALVFLFVDFVVWTVFYNSNIVI